MSLTPCAGTPELKKLLDQTKAKLFWHKGAGFLGPLLCSVEFRWTTDIPTACIGPSELYWNPDFFLSLDPETRVTVLAHELWHNGFLHGARRGDRCPDYWNIAADHVINLFLEEHGFYMGGFPYVMDHKYAGWTTEEIYDDFNIKQIALPDNPLGNDVMDVPAGQVSKAVAKVVQAMTTAKLSGAKPGDIPGEVGMVLDKFLNPKLPWEVLLYNFFNALSEQEYSYRRPNRRFDDPLLPGPAGNNGLEHLVYFVDISGSITDQQILRMNSEVKFIQEELEPERLTLITFDHGMRDVYEFERDDPFEKIEIIGRGGTCLEEPFAYLRAHQPNAAIIFTDLEVTIPKNPGVPIVWVCVENSSAEVPFGQLIHFSEQHGARYA